MTQRKIIFQQIKYLKEESASSFLLLLVAADIIFIAAYFLHVHTSIFEIYLFSLTIDRSYSEIYQYIKELWIILLILSIMLKTKEIGYISWAMLFTYMLFDDAFFIHEQVGSLIAKNLDIMPVLGVKHQDIGELAITLISMVLLLVLIGFFSFRGSGLFKKISRDLLILLVVIAFFGVFIDLIHASVELGWRGNFVLDVLEDGGEMIAISLVAWYLFLLNAREGVPNFSLYELLREILTRRAT